MSARINLAPEVYQHNQQSKRRKRLATSIAIGVAVVSGGFVVAMLVILGAQKAVIASLSGDIKSRQNQINGITDLQKAATAQAHLDAWGQVTNSKTHPSKFFEVLQDYVPQGISVSSITVNQQNQLELDGNAKTYALVTKFVKALEAANVEIGPNASPTATPYFTNTQLTSASQANGVVNFHLTTQLASEVTSGN